jgi:uncharacterized protein YeaO (DUF488 family)
MPVRTKRWNDAIAPDDGLRVLICRYRPRGVPSAGEPWDAWTTALAPSKALHAAAYGKGGNEKLPFEEYARRFRAEMASQKFWIDGFAKRVAAGETVTLLCSSACTDEARCHRSIVKQLLEEVASPTAPAPHPHVRRRA